MNFSNKLKIGCVIMASGLSKRFGSNKLIKELGGKPLINWILDATDELFSYRVVVTRSKDVEVLCKAGDIPVVYHEYPGRNDTVRLGLMAMPKDIAGCMFCMADQPLISRVTIQNMLSGFNEDKGIIRTAFGETPGAPILFSDKYFDELMNLPQGKGGNVVVKTHPEEVHMVQAGISEELFDIDTQEDFRYISSFIENKNLK